MHLELHKHLVDYAATVMGDSKSKTPPIALQRMLKDIQPEQIMMMPKSNIPFKQLQYYKEYPSVLEVDIKSYKMENDLAVLSAIYAGKILSGMYTQQINLIIKLLAKKFEMNEHLVNVNTFL